MNLNHTEETIAIVKAAVGLRGAGKFCSSWVINNLRGTKYWNAKAGNINRVLLLQDLAENPWSIRNIQGIGEQTENEIFRHLLATVGEK